MFSPAGGAEHTLGFWIERLARGGRAGFSRKKVDPAFRKGKKMCSSRTLTDSLAQGAEKKEKKKKHPKKKFQRIRDGGPTPNELLCSKPELVDKKGSLTIRGLSRLLRADWRARPKHFEKLSQKPLSQGLEQARTSSEGPLPSQPRLSSTPAVVGCLSCDRSSPWHG